MDILFSIGIALLGVAVFVLVYWQAKRANAKENGETPPTLMQTLRSVIQRGGGKGEE